MFGREFGSSAPRDDDELQARLAGLAADRVDPIEARLDFWRWGGVPFLPTLTRIGKAHVAWAMVALIVADAAQALLLGSLPLAIAGLGAVGLILVFASRNLERWVAERNARVDARLRELQEHAPG